MIWPLYPQGRSPWYPLARRLGGPQSRSVCGGLEKNSQSTLGTEPQNPNRPAHSPAIALKVNIINILFQWVYYGK